MIAKFFPIALLTVALAGCSRSEPEASAPANAVAVPVSPPAAPAPASRPAPAPTRTADVPTLPPPPDIAANEQMLDDASATGMTARVERDGEESLEPPLNDADVP